MNAMEEADVGGLNGDRSSGDELPSWSSALPGGRGPEGVA
jgi:hypothetical protein